MGHSHAILNGKFWKLLMAHYVAMSDLSVRSRADGARSSQVTFRSETSNPKVQAHKNHLFIPFSYIFPLEL